MTVHRAWTPLRVSAAVELASLVVMPANLATAHLPAVSSLMGPLHGVGLRRQERYQRGAPCGC
ncbi:hypothetical protein [Streptomyces sp. NPDC017529]|uniref:hypothetical protein n=1 Tax=Streptomyces sp. NPDC017529 TaxID=3365000 RepID=UPI0037A41C92